MFNILKRWIEINIQIFSHHIHFNVPRQLIKCIISCESIIITIALNYFDIYILQSKTHPSGNVVFIFKETDFFPLN